MNSLRHTILGLFLFTALAVLGFATIYLGDFNLRGTHGYTVYFESVDGLQAGSPVMVYGVEQGRVREIVFSGDSQPERRLAVEIRLQQELNLREGWSIAIADQSLLGGKRIEIETGDGAPIESADLIGATASNPVRSVGRVVNDNEEDMRRFVASLADITASLASGERSLAEYLLDTSASADLTRTLANVQELSDTLLRGEGSLAQLVQNPDAYGKLLSALDRADALFALATEGDGSVARLLRDDALYTQLESTASTLAELSDRVGRGEGLIGRALAPESHQILEDAEETVANLRALSERVIAGEGLAGMLFQNEDFSARLDRIVFHAETISEDLVVMLEEVREGRGVLGYLVSDDEARRQVQRLVALITGAVEDVREAAPVSSFASFLFGQL